MDIKKEFQEYCDWIDCCPKDKNGNDLGCDICEMLWKKDQEIEKLRMQLRELRGRG